MLSLSQLTQLGTYILFIICRFDTNRLNSSLKFPDLTEARELDTLEYSHNKEELSISKLDNEARKLFQENYSSKERTLDKYLVKTAEKGSLLETTDKDIKPFKDTKDVKRLIPRSQNASDKKLKPPMIKKPTHIK